MPNNQSTQPTSGRRQRGVQREKRAVTRNRWWLLGGGVIVVLLIMGLVLAPRSAMPATTPTHPTGDERAIGPASAPVTIVEYGDFGCTTCRAWHNAGILQQVINKYGNNVHFVWRDFPVITPQSPRAAEAGRCAADQGKFWAYHDVLYARQPVLDVESLKSYAAQLGLDAARFNQCLDSSQHQAEVDRDLQDALARRFTGTPSFLINDKPLAGPPSFQTLQSLIDPLLAKGG